MASLRSMEATHSTCSSQSLDEKIGLSDSTSLTIFENLHDPSKIVKGYRTPIDWYPVWIENQWQKAPPSIKARVQDFLVAFVEVANLIKARNTVQEIATSLLQSGHFEAHGRYEEDMLAVDFVFAVLGWQTMLYEASFGTAPPGHLAISDVLEGYNGYSYMSWKQDVARAEAATPELLVGFGLMLPRANICISDDPDDCQAFEKVSVVRPEELNIAFLSSLAKVKIQWIDVLAPHLEFDKATNTLFLFRHPSFCIATIPRGHDGQDSLHFCASDNNDSTQWASNADVTQLMKEIVLSYRLLFGQDLKSRRIFTKTNAFSESSQHVRDPWLDLLCTGKSMQLPAGCVERDFYRMNRDFPILHSRIAVLQHHMISYRPKSWVELWKDSRDSAQWWTFWAVIALGLAGVILAAVQVVLQAAQLARS